MKKIALTIAIVLGITIGAFAQEGGLFGLGKNRESTDLREGENNNSLLNLPNAHGETNDQGAPLGSGALLLIGFGAAYALKKRRK
jgi:hypothetical protein